MASMITAGPDGALWFTLNQAHAIGRLGIDGDAAIYPLPTRDAAPVGIAASTDAIWFVEIAAGQVGRISPDGVIDEFPLLDRSARPHAIVADRDDGCWLSEWGNSRVAHLTADGHIREIALPTASEPHGLAIGPDGALWVALETGSVARIEI
jgi:virginiamycin B lyase